MAKVLHRLVVWLAFAGAMLAPALARAAILPSCDGHEQLTRILPTPAPAAPVPDDRCDAGAPQAGGAAEDAGDVRIAAMCDDRGASMVAPQRILPIPDDRIEAGPHYDDDSSGPRCGPGPDHAPAAAPGPALAEHAVLDGQLLVPPASSELAPPFPPVAGGPLPGHLPGIDHPPR